MTEISEEKNNERARELWQRAIAMKDEAELLTSTIGECAKTWDFNGQAPALRRHAKEIIKHYQHTARAWTNKSWLEISGSLVFGGVSLDEPDDGLSSGTEEMDRKRLRTCNGKVKGPLDDGFKTPEKEKGSKKEKAAFQKVEKGKKKTRDASSK